MNRKEYIKQYRITNREKLLKKMRENRKRYYLKNKEKELIKHKKWREKNPEHIKDYYQKNKEHILKLNKEYYKKNREHILKLMGKWKIKYKEYCKRYSNKYYKTEEGKANKQRAKSKRRSTMKDIVNTLTSQEWKNILKAYNHRCAYCGREFNLLNKPEKDHVIPISKGGDNTKDNIVPACRRCNAKKNNKILKRNK